MQLHMKDIFEFGAYETNDMLFIYIYRSQTSTQLESWQKEVPGHDVTDT